MTMTYAIVKTGGKQYRVEEGQTLLVERLPADAGANVPLEPLLYRGDKDVLDGADLAKVKVEAKVLAHERGPKLHVLKFKPKRGYKRRTGHRQELTRIEVTSIKAGARAPARKPAAKADGEPAAETAAKKPATRRPAAKKPGGAAAKPRTRRPPAKKKEDE
ncbi:MAG: large subunit ribosomal protein [Solirubrobacteraceae bacterium]|nr:large subunit ribosomal protein [Solirubrobacteraceae bacterium]